MHVSVTLCTAVTVSAACFNIPKLVMKVTEYLWGLFLSRNKERLFLNIIRQRKKYSIFRFWKAKSFRVWNVLAAGAVSRPVTTHTSIMNTNWAILETLYAHYVIPDLSRVIFVIFCTKQWWPRACCRSERCCDSTVRQLMLYGVGVRSGCAHMYPST